MAKFGESAHVMADPGKAWETASDLSRLGDWLTMHEAWRGDLPELAEGAELTSVVNIKGLRNRITWTITTFDPPRALTLTGEGVGGTDVSLILGVAADGDGSRIAFDVEFAGKLVTGPIAMTIKPMLRAEVRTSINQLAKLID